ncbi:sensor histidine kinase [Stenotrophomonas sp. HITSZ_GD]|uniref:sensor histidine kinase n=1 Tax=Stenotrophomonas sp. HITSZ_GD TaxID=3037248 RepID=UPI00240DB94A|nr:sensor histidine kinase [Stenotrophomonas sp. HITSZ_GD]MDG2523775.1 sensor histidine kinase [Stenotrophomonas sp. HITSZ_GD]
MPAFLEPAPDSLVGLRNAGGSHGRTWFPLLMLAWSVWIFLTPLFSAPAFRDWLWPTLASYAAFLVLYRHAYYRSRAHLLACALGIAALGFALTPFNPGAQGYLVYACAFLAFVARPKGAVLWMVGVLGAYALVWLWLGFPLIYLFSVLMVGLAVGLMNISIQRRTQADIALRLSHDEVRRLAGVAERERIGRDLHDLLGHTLSLVALKADLAGRLVERDPAAARREIDEVARVSRDALAQVRHAVTGIRAAELVAELASAHLLLESDEIVLHYTPPALPLPSTLETALALTVREAVTNVQRHARARQVWIALECTREHVLLRVRDDGRGGDIVPGNGLHGMGERLRALGGELRIDARPGAGTELQARLPWPRAGIAAAEPTPT